MTSESAGGARSQTHPTDGITGDHAGDEPACADARNRGTGIEQRMKHRCAQARSKKKEDILAFSELILDVISENQQKIKIADQMPDSAVKKH